jgi:hypothetical protein
MSAAGITLDDLHARLDFAAAERAVGAALDAALGDGESLLRFLGRYVLWNAGFGAGVAQLAAKIARSRALFLDPDEPIAALADRSTHVASFFFDAARDEFDDRATPHRDTHRTLAQATLRGVAEQFGLLQRAEELLAEPDWLRDLNEGVQRGYGLGVPDDLPGCFFAMGFHVGSEILADSEFSRIDNGLRAGSPELVKRLLSRRIRVAGHEHPAYYWIGVHSGQGGGVEAEHFEWATGGVREGLRYVRAEERDALKASALHGFDRFARIHRDFFGRVAGS